MAKFSLLLTDFQELTLPSHARFFEKGRVVFEDSPKAVAKQLRQPKLLIGAKWSHSGVLINRRVYPGPRMKDSIPSLLDGYGKPFFRGHPPDPSLFAPSPPESKVLGRVTKASYVQLVNDALWMHDWEHPEPTGCEGSGYAMVQGFIGDAEAIEEVLDGRLLTLSSGHRPVQFFCSICKKDWLDSGPCNHELGKTYEIDTKARKGKFQAYGITGNLIYDHGAFVNRPADVGAQVFEKRFADALQHSGLVLADHAPAGRLLRLALVDSYGGRVLEMDAAISPTDTKASGTASNAPPEVPQVTSVIDLRSELGPKETKMSATQRDSSGMWTAPDPVDGHTHKLIALDEKSNGRVAPTEGEEIPEHDHEILGGRVLPTNGEGYVSRHPGTYFYDQNERKARMALTENDPADGKTLEPQKAAPPAADAAKPPATQTDAQAGEKPKPEPAPKPEREYDESDANPTGVEVMGADELADHQEMVDLFQQGLLPDAVLTTAVRKKLPDSSFCGPNRSFPVPDAAHARNALARLGQGLPKGAPPETKARIKACVLRKAKALGVKTGDSAAGDAGVLTTTVRTLTAEIDRSKSEITRLEGVVNEQAATLKTAQKRSEDLAAEKRELLADRVLDLMLALGKPQTQEASTPEKLKEVKAELLKRSVDSLKDSARDLQLELAQGSGSGFRPGSETSPPTSRVGSLGGTPTAGAGSPEKDSAKKAALAKLGVGKK